MSIIPNIVWAITRSCRHAHQGGIRAGQFVINSVTQGRFMWANRPHTGQRKAAPAGGREGVCVVLLGVGWLGVVLVAEGIVLERRSEGCKLRK